MSVYSEMQINKTSLLALTNLNYWKACK